MNNSKKIYLAVVMLSTFLIALIPVFHVGLSVGKEWKGVVPEYIEDSAYYYARINDVVRGNPLIGNPYFIEYKDEIPPAFFVSDWLASLPFFIGLPFSVSVVFNIILWSLIFITIIYFLFNKFGMDPKLSAVCSIIVYFQVFWLFVRPVSMQVIFPAYLLFLYAIFHWQEEPLDKKRSWFLVIASIYSIYIYTYLMQLVLVTYGLLVLFYFYKKNNDYLKNLFRILLLIFVSSLPFLLVTFFQVSHPLYTETLNRIGFLETHLPRMELYYYGRWVVFTIIIWYFSRRFFGVYKTEDSKKLFNFFLLTGTALLITASSNIITGKELELANHLGRFITLWFPVAFTTYLFLFYKVLKDKGETTNRAKKLIIGFFVVIGIFVMIRNVPRAFTFFRNSPDSMSKVQTYKDPLMWLEKNIEVASVIWATDRLSVYIPIETSHYVLFHPSAFLQIVSDKELEERYLISQFLRGGATRDKIEQDVGIYGGAGKALLGPSMQVHFDGMYKVYTEQISVDILTHLKKFGVRYIVVDGENNIEIEQVNKLPVKEVHRSENFVVYILLF